jgi:hypothetical protein
MHRLLQTQRFMNRGSENFSSCFNLILSLLSQGLFLAVPRDESGKLCPTKIDPFGRTMVLLTKDGVSSLSMALSVNKNGDNAGIFDVYM